MSSSELVRPFKNEDINILSNMAKNSFLASYRYNDAGFDKNKINELYSEWIINSCNGRADTVLVYDNNGIPEGFIACNLNKDKGIIDLVAVSENSRGKGIGLKLVSNSLLWFKEGVNLVEVSTEAMNYASLNIYHKAGFKIIWTGFDLNYWY